MKRYKIASRAADDIREISIYTQARFGDAMQDRYDGLVRRAVVDIVTDPMRHGTLLRPDLGEGMLAFHLRHVRQQRDVPKVRSPRHLLIYHVARNGFITILRVLHENMDIARHIGNDN